MFRNKKWTGFYAEHEPVLSNTSGPSATRQEFKDECDINTIMIRYEATGVINHFQNGQPVYLDLDGFPRDLQGTLGMLAEAEEAFMRLPAHVRREFDNSPVAFVDFVDKGDASLPKLREWGLAPPAPLPDAPKEPPPAA